MPAESGARYIDGVPEKIGPHAVTLLDALYFPAEHVTWFQYQISANPSARITHWDIGFESGCGAATDLFDSNELPVWIDGDLTTGLRGLRFAETFDAGEDRTVWFTLKGQWEFDLVIVAIMTGHQVDYGTVLGPVCADSGGGQLRIIETQEKMGVATNGYRHSVHNREQRDYRILTAGRIRIPALLATMTAACRPGVPQKAAKRIMLKPTDWRNR